MSNMFFVVCIVAIACVTGVLIEFFKSRAISGKRDSSDDSLSQIDALEERIRVLERIITENRFDLKKEIDRL